MDNIKIVRLHTGEDIVADCLDDENQLLMDNPMHLIFKRGPAGGKVMLLLPWLPIELIESNIISIPYKDIATFMQPRKELIDYYLQVVSAVNEQMNYNLNIGDDEQDKHHQLLQQMLEEAIEEKKNSNIH
jgi:hypothetical protein